MKILFVTVCFLFGMTAFGQVTDAPSAQEWNAVFSSLAGIGGMKAAAIIALVVQVLMLLVRQFIQGKWKLAIVSGLTLLGAIVGAFVDGGGGIASIFTNAVVLTSVQVLFHQIYSQVKK